MVGREEQRVQDRDREKKFDLKSLLSCCGRRFLDRAGGGGRNLAEGIGMAAQLRTTNRGSRLARQLVYLTDECIEGWTCRLWRSIRSRPQRGLILGLIYAWSDGRADPLYSTAWLDLFFW